MLTWFIWNRTHPPKIEHEHWLKELKYERETHAQRQSERAARGRGGSVSKTGKAAPDEISLAPMSSQSSLLATGGASSTSPSPAQVSHLSPLASGHAKSDDNNGSSVALQPVTTGGASLTSQPAGADDSDSKQASVIGEDITASNPDEEAAAISGSMA
jgi:hypothetical protein